MVVEIGGMKFYLNHKKFFSHTVIASSNDGSIKITVGLVKDFLDYVLSIKAIKNPVLDRYKKAKKVFDTFVSLLDNKQFSKPSKDCFKAAADVIEEIENMKAITDEQKEFNARMCLVVKLLIEGYST